MALGYFDRLCSTCGTRFGIHYSKTIFEGDNLEYFCPNLSGPEYWKFEYTFKFKDSGKLRSNICDKRNHPDLKAY